MSDTKLDLLLGTETCLVAEVPAAGDRWQQVHLNAEIVRRFFNLSPGTNLSITLEKISSNGLLSSRTSRQLVIPDSNRNSRIEFDFGPRLPYPASGRPIVVVVESNYLTYRYRTLMPDDLGHSEMGALLSAGPSVGKGVRRRLVTLDDVESHWSGAQLRGQI